MAEGHPLGRMSYEAFLAMEAASETKHEFVSGEVYAMAGGTVEHGRLAVRFAVILSGALNGRPCVGARYSRVIPAHVGDTLHLRAFPDAELLVADVLR